MGVLILKHFTNILNSLFFSLKVMGKTYQVTMTEAQLKVVSEACDLLARIQLGQWTYAFDHLPIDKDIDWGIYHLVKDRIQSMTPLILEKGMDGVSGSYGVSHPSLPPQNGIAFDIRDVIRHKLAWEKAVEEGIVESVESPRKWPAMIGVDYGTPTHWGSEPLIEIK